MVGEGRKCGEHRSSKAVRAMPEVVEGRVDIQDKCHSLGK